MKIKDVMNKNPIVVSPNDIGGEVVQLLYKEGKYYAPVVEDGKLVGWITALDLLAGCKHSKIEDLMLLIDEIKILNENDELTNELIDEMVNNEIIAYPVINDKEELVGTLSIFDLFKYKDKLIKK
ncbi:Putative signal transduction protein with CBS domains [Methanocaldococcus lauensis]|uniref:Signal transduction protein with CBS domains n=1 Tax=Methanocaldococcus lauensis TaxID=2546128 RepID=A0A8D6T194_9EURY|nr:MULTISPECIES: CBS domain-containing protein [Methanocaldococcus]MCQ6253633.1 CBS domain-containing protein [Methanocaldococcus sp.]CAB3287448.1 Putative signal transduction protein with CBS domains [Methanocaldococcus lauensis]CAB3290026.1 Putative signal transduction protein with CBS domains [Methanocaldococcus lauensis]